jgi:hypothetical protein
LSRAQPAHASKISPGIFYYSSTFYELRPWSRTASRNCTAAKEKKRKEKKRESRMHRSQCRQNGTAAHAALLSGSDAADPAVTGRRRRDLCCSLCTCRPGTSRLRPAGLGTDVAAVASGHAAAVTPGQRHRRPAGRRTHVCLCGWSGALAVPVPRATVPGSGFLMCCLGQSVACCRGAVAFAHLSFG